MKNDKLGEIVHQIVKKSKNGGVKQITSIYFEIEHPNTLAASVLMKKDYWDQDPDNPYHQRMALIGLSRAFLNEEKQKHGDIVCHYCEKPGLIIEEHEMNVPNNIKATIDHVVPISKDGLLFDVSNLVPACGKCNSKKGSMSYDNFKKIVKRYDYKLHSNSQKDKNVLNLH